MLIGYESGSTFELRTNEREHPHREALLIERTLAAKALLRLLRRHRGSDQRFAGAMIFFRLREQPKLYVALFAFLQRGRRLVNRERAGERFNCCLMIAAASSPVRRDNATPSRDSRRARSRV